MSLVTADGGLTSLGYAVSIIAIIVFLLVAAFIRGKASEGKKKEGLKTTTKQLVFCAAAMALAFVTSYLKIFSLPFGGSVTLFSMLFICLIGYWYRAPAFSQAWLMVLYSLSRSPMSLASSRYAAIISWLLQP